MTEIKTKKSAEGIIKNLVNLVGSTAGIILVSIGAITFLNVALKTYVFKVDNNGYGYRDNVEEQCNYLNPDRESLNKALKKLGADKFGGPMPVDVYGAKVSLTKENAKDKKEIKALTAEEKSILKKEYDKCLVDKKEQQEKSDWNDKGHQMAWGLAFLIVGFPILFYYQSRSRKYKNKK